MKRRHSELLKTTVIRAGFLTSVQDSGRTGHREFGVSLGGALDRHALQVANLIASNDQSAAGLEITLGGLQLRFNDQRIVAWCGGEFNVQVGSTSLPAGHAAVVDPGEEMTFNQPGKGCRCWLAISGGIDVPMVLGSLSTDLRAGFGGLYGRALRDGDELPLGGKPGATSTATGKLSSWSAPYDWASPARSKPVLRFVRGADWNRFDASTHDAFTKNSFAVSSESDRMGVRLEETDLMRNNHADLISEAVAPGTVQVPPAGNPILLLGDCQTIGGYPKIAHVISVDQGIAAQLQAGDRVGFSEASSADAHHLLLERDREMERFRIGLSLRRS